MGKGDRRSLKGKRWRHSYGVSRKKNNGKGQAFVPKAKKEKKVAVESAEAVVESTEEKVAKKATGAKKAPAKKKAPAAKKSSKKKEE